MSLYVGLILQICTMNFLIAGLGNIGSEYAFTRHNIGFDVADELARKHAAPAWEMGRLAYTTAFKIKGHTLYCIKPSTYMNLSGKAVKYHADAHKIQPQNILVITDDLALPLAKLRLKPKGSDGGHNGLKSINEILNTINYPRLRFGIGSDFAKGRQADFVLGKWKPEEEPDVRLGIDRAVNMIESFVLSGLQNTMNAFNG